jgi:uncharacterized RDD family membrane protein YckC
MVYDTLIAVAIGMLSALVFIAILTALLETGVLPKLGFEHVSDLVQQNWVYKTVIQVWVVCWVSTFFLWFWKNGGQTLGMRAWRIRIFNLKEHEPVGYKRLFIRLIGSLGGLGTLLVLLDFKNKLALQDRLTNTEVLVLTKEENHHRAW